jgi:3-dehydroquinate synthetase
LPGFNNIVHHLQSPEETVSIHLDIHKTISGLVERMGKKQELIVGVGGGVVGSVERA